MKEIAAACNTAAAMIGDEASVALCWLVAVVDVDDDVGGVLLR